MTVYFDSFCKCTIPDVHKLLPENTSVVLTSNKFGICAQIEKYCMEKNIPIMIIKPYNEENGIDLILHVNFIATVSKELFLIGDENSTDTDSI